MLPLFVAGAREWRASHYAQENMEFELTAILGSPNPGLREPGAADTGEGSASDEPASGRPTPGIDDVP
jgi:hypothetical protein